jgi:steroid 5-alpha reductase family enzyme
MNIGLGEYGMIYIILGIIAFGFFVLYDVNSIIMKNRLLSCCFFVGFILLTAATFGLVITAVKEMDADVFKTILFGALAVISFLLMIYSLFFALPFQKTYMKTEDKGMKVCKVGVYALCRHPGVLSSTCLYLSLGLALMTPLMMTAAVIFSILNILYICFQDLWTFPKSFPDYRDYKKSTPFLLPNQKSIRRCLQTLRWKEGTV